MKSKIIVLMIFIFCCNHIAMARDGKLFNQLDVQTVGNHSYVRIGVYRTPDEYSSKILAILEEFEKLNPDKDVVDWKIEKQQKGYVIIRDYIFGLWIDHRPK